MVVGVRVAAGEGGEERGAAGGGGRAAGRAAAVLGRDLIAPHVASSDACSRGKEEGMRIFVSSTGFTGQSEQDLESGLQ